MKFQASALAILIGAVTIDVSAAFGIVGQKSSFVAGPLRMQTVPQAKNGMTMLAGGSGGIEEMKDVTKEGDKLTQSAKKSPGLFKNGGLAAIPAAALFGAVLTPGAIAASAVGASVTGVAGFIGKNRLDAATVAAAKPAVAQAIIDLGVDSSTIAGAISDIRTTFNVQEEDFAVMLGDIYMRYLIGMVKTPITMTNEMKELTNLRNALGMDNLAVGAAHAAAAKEFYRQTSIFTPIEDLEDPDHPDRMSIDKFLFLSERAFRQGGETEEAFKYEMSRVAKAFNIKVGETLERVAEVAEPFYQKALDSTRSKLDTDAVSSDMLLRARNSLGVDETTAQDMHMTAFADEVKSLLIDADDSEKARFSDVAQERLTKLQDILGLKDAEASYEVAAEGTPLFQSKALIAMNEAIAGTMTPADAWGQMQIRQKELLLTDDSMKDLLSSMVMQVMGKPFEDTMTFANVNNEGATYTELLQALSSKEACRDVLQLSGWEEFADFDSKFFDPSSKSSACGMLARKDRLRLYRIFLNRSVRNSESGKELTDENYDKVKDAKSMLGITDEDEAVEFRMNFGPELQKSLNMAMFEIMGDDFTPELVSNLREIVDKTISDYKLSEDLVTELASPIYMRAASLANDKSPSGIPSTEITAQLKALRDLLGMSEEDTFSAHVDVFGNQYRQSVLESMGSTGVITKEYREPLETLRARLGVSEEASRALYLDAMGERMKPMVEWIVLELERTMLTAEQLANKRQADYGEDFFKSGRKADGNLGIGADANIMTDCMNLIDFYNENDITEKKESGTKTIEKVVNEGDEEKTISEEVPDYEMVYPITGLESGAITLELAELLFRQFVVGGFTTQGPQGERYEAARSAFGGIIGLDKEKQEEIASSIGGTVYENYISNSMRTKGTLDQQDMMFLANIQNKLDISADKSEEMLLDTQKKILKEEANTILRDDVEPAMIKAFREKCNSMGIEIVKDLGLSQSSVEEMFEAEVSPALVEGEITIESGDLLSDIQDSLGMDPEEAEKIFLGILQKRAQAVMSRIKGELLRERDDNCPELILRLVRYAQFVNGEDLELIVDEANGWKVYNMYDAMDFEGQDSENVQANKDLLKIALNLEE